MNDPADWLVEWAKTPQRYDILVLLPNLGRGGAQRVASLLIDAWAARGYRVCVATFSDKTEDAHRLDRRVTRLKIREFLRIRTGRTPAKEKKAPPLRPSPAVAAAVVEQPAAPSTVAVVAPAASIHVVAPVKVEGLVIERPVAEATVAVVGKKPANVDSEIVDQASVEVVVEHLVEPSTASPTAIVSVAEVQESPETGAANVTGVMDVLRTIKRTVRRRVRSALFPVREAGRMLRRQAREVRRQAREVRRLGREARRVTREARRNLRAAGREARREARAAVRSARDSWRTAARSADRGISDVGSEMRKGLRLRFAMVVGVLDLFAPITDRLHLRGAVQCLRALRGTARNAGLAQRVIIEHRDLLTDRAKCRQVLAARMLMEHVQAPVTLAFLGATNIIAALARHGLPTRLVISERNDPVRQELQPVWQELRPLMYRGADVVTANSLGAVDTMRGWMPASRLAYVPNPLRVPPDPGTRRWRRGPAFISVGRLVPQKRVDLVIAAFAGLDGLDDWSLEILGDGPERPALEALAERLGAKDRVRFHGHVDPFPHLYAADIFVLFSDFEGMPNALLAAMACGVVPIVGDATPGPLEFVVDDETGLVVPADDPDRLAQAMRLLAVDELGRARLAAAARQRMDELAFDHVLESWSEVLRLPVPPDAPRLAGVAR